MEETTSAEVVMNGEAVAQVAANNEKSNDMSSDSAAEIARLKNALTKSNNEAAELKKQLRAKMTDDEAAKAQADADRKALEDKYTELLRKSTIAEHTARYIAMPGYDEKLARETAEALFDGDMEKVFANQQKANAAYEKKLRADLVKQDPKPDGAGGGNGEKDEAVEFAKKLGKQRADALKNANEGLKHYF